MSYIGWLFGYGKPDVSSTPPPSGPELTPSGPELTPGWEVYKNQRGEILYGNKPIRKCNFSAPVVQAPVAQAQTASGKEPEYPSWYSTEQKIKAHEAWLRQNMMDNPYFGGRKRMQSRRKQSRRKQSRRKSRRHNKQRRHTKTRRTMKGVGGEGGEGDQTHWEGVESTLNRVKRMNYEDIAAEIDSMYADILKDGKVILELKSELELCNENLNRYTNALKRAGTILDQDWKLI